jgi:septation ring formation regulator EzrA
MSKIDEIKKLLGMEVKAEEVVNVELAEAETEKKEPVAETEESVKVEVKYATQQELAEVESKFMNMFKAFLEEAKKEVKEVPQELSAEKKEEVELAEAKEIVHSPENEVEKKEVKFSKPLSAMTPQERVFAMLNK